MWTWYCELRSLRNKTLLVEWFQQHGWACVKPTWTTLTEELKYAKVYLFQHRKLFEKHLQLVEVWQNLRKLIKKQSCTAHCLIASYIYVDTLWACHAI